MIGLMMILLVYFFRHGTLSGLWVELVLLSGMGMKLKDKIMLQGCREGFCKYGPATGISCWVYDVLGKSCMTSLSGLMGSKAGSCFSEP